MTSFVIATGLLGFVGGVGCLLILLRITGNIRTKEEYASHLARRQAGERILPKPASCEACGESGRIVESQLGGRYWCCLGCGAARYRVVGPPESTE